MYAVIVALLIALVSLANAIRKELKKFNEDRL